MLWNRIAVPNAAFTPAKATFRTWKKFNPFQVKWQFNGCNEYVTFCFNRRNFANEFRYWVGHRCWVVTHFIWAVWPLLLEWKAFRNCSNEIRSKLKHCTTMFYKNCFLFFYELYVHICILEINNKTQWKVSHYQYESWFRCYRFQYILDSFDITLNT